jgi:hypothetical protein
MDNSAGAAFVGIAVASIHSIYTQHAGSLCDCRQAASDSLEVSQRLQDADMLTGILVGITGLALLGLTRRVEPLVISLAAYGATSFYYHRAFNMDGAY